MKLYEQEVKAHDFWKGWHSLQEWADFGFNCVYLDNKKYWDGKLNGEEDIEPSENMYELDYFDFDDDGYIIVYIKLVDYDIE